MKRDSFRLQRRGISYDRCLIAASLKIRTFALEILPGMANRCIDFVLVVFLQIIQIEVQTLRIDYRLCSLSALPCRLYNCGRSMRLQGLCC